RGGGGTCGGREPPEVRGARSERRVPLLCLRRERPPSCRASGASFGIRLRNSGRAPPAPRRLEAIGAGDAVRDVEVAVAAEARDVGAEESAEDGRVVHADLVVMEARTEGEIAAHHAGAQR